MSESAALATEVVDLPGIEEANRISRAYAKAMEGLRGFVAVGFELVDVKDRLPHGQYMAWVKKFLPSLSHAHLHRARLCAEGLSKMTGIKFIPGDKFENLPPEITAIIDGATGYRALLSSVHEFRQDEAEEEAKRKCYEEFAKDPALQDEWEPRVLSGELDWCQARRGITGRLATLGNKRADPDYVMLIPRVITTLKNGFTKWDAIPEDKQEGMVSSLRDLLTSMPPSVRQALGLNKS